MYAQLIDLPWTMGLYINHFMLDLSKIILFTTAKKKNPLCPSYFKRDSNIHVWNKTNWEEHSDTKDIYNGFNLETISWESVFDLIRAIYRGKQGHRTGLNKL